MPTMRRSGFALLLTLALATPAVSAQAQATDEVVASRGGVSLLMSELDSGLRQVPEEMRGAYMRDPTRVARLIDNLLIAKQIATEARNQGLHREPEMAADLLAAENELLVKAYLARQLPPPADEATLEELAIQTYRANPQRFRSEPVWDISYLLASTDGRSEDEAKALAESLLAKARAGEPLEDLIKEATSAQTTPDPPAGGSIKSADLAKMDTAFVVAVKSIQKEGDWSEPVRTRFGYHIARLDRFAPAAVRPLEEVKKELMDELRAQAQQTARTAAIRRFSQQDTQLNDELIAGLRQRYAIPDAPAAAAGEPAGED